MEGEFGNQTGAGGFSLWVGVAAFVGLVLGLALAIAYFYPRLARKHEGLSAQQLTAALGIHYWEFTIPENDGTSFPTFEIQDGDATELLGRVENSTQGERVLVTLRRNMRNRTLECSIVRENGKGNYWQILDDPFVDCHSFHYAPDGVSVNDRWIMKGNRHGGVVVFPVDRVDPGDVILRLVTKPHP